jgi:hypothetical protein
VYRPVLADGRRECEGERSLFVQTGLLCFAPKALVLRGGDGFGLAWASKDKMLVDNKEREAIAK